MRIAQSAAPCRRPTGTMAGRKLFKIISLPLGAIHLSRGPGLACMIENQHALSAGIPPRQLRDGKAFFGQRRSGVNPCSSKWLVRSGCRQPRSDSSRRGGPEIRTGAVGSTRCGPRRAGSAVRSRRIGTTTTTTTTLDLYRVRTESSDLPTRWLSGAGRRNELAHRDGYGLSNAWCSAASRVSAP